MLSIHDLRNTDSIHVYLRVSRDHIAQRPPLPSVHPPHRAVATKTTGRKRRRKVSRRRKTLKGHTAGLDANLRDAAVIPQTAKERRGWSRKGASPARDIARAPGAGAG